MNANQKYIIFNQIIDQLSPPTKMSTLTTFFVTSTPNKKSGSPKMLNFDEQITDEEMDDKNQLIAIRSELQFRIDDLETLLDRASKENKLKEKQLSEQMSTIQQLRHFRDNSVELNEYQMLNEKVVKLSKKCDEYNEALDTLKKRMSSEINENELLHQKIDSKDKEIEDNKKNLIQCLNKVKEQELELREMNGLNQRFTELQKELDRERAENQRLNELLNVWREEHLRHNESDISVEDLNQSINKFLNTFNNSSVGESMDCVLNTKLNEAEIAFEDKCREYELILSENQNLKDIIDENEKQFKVKSNEIQVISQMNEELQNQTKALNEEMNEKVTELKTFCTQLESDVEDLATKCVVLSEQNQSADKELNDFKQKLVEMEAERESTLNQIDSLESDIFEERQKVFSFEEKIQRLVEELNNKTDENKNLNKELIASKELLVETKEERDVIQNKIYSLNDKLCETQTTLEEKCREYDVIFASNQHLKETITENERQFAVKCNEMQVISQMNEELQNQTKALNEEMNEKVTKLKSFCSQLESNFKDLTTECDSLSEQNQSLTKEILDSNQERKELNETIVDKERQLIEKCNEIQDISQMNEELKNQIKALNEEKNQMIIELTSKCTDLETKVEEFATKFDSISELNQSLVKEILELKEQKELTHKQIEFLEKNLSEEKQKLDSTKKQANEELQEMHSVVDKSFNNLKEKNSFLTQSLSEEKEKSIRLENELKNVKHIQSQQMDNIHNECVKTISDLRTRLTTEEMSFEFERKNKERYANENQSYLKKIQTLENEVKRLNDLINKPIESNSYYCMPTTFNINTTGVPQQNYTNQSLSSMDISDANVTNISLNVSRKPPIGTGSRLIMADEEGEFMNPNNLIALKNGECFLDDSLVDDQRLSILQKRNTMVLPHLRTSYAVELPFMKENVSPEKIRQGLTVKDSNVFVKPSTDEHQSRRYSKSFSFPTLTPSKKTIQSSFRIINRKRNLSQITK